MTASANLSRLADRFGKLGDTALARVDDEAKRIVAAAAPFPSMRGKKRGGLPVRMAENQDPKPSSDGGTFRVQGTVPGWIWANTGTRAHRIPRRHGGGKHRLSVQHPGSPGRHAWARVVSALHAQLPKVIEAEVSKVVRSYG